MIIQESKETACRLFDTFLDSLSRTKKIDEKLKILENMVEYLKKRKEKIRLEVPENVQKELGLWAKYREDSRKSGIVR